MAWAVSNKGIRFIACREALVLAAYPDGEKKDGTILYSIGFGRSGAKPNDKTTIQQAFKDLAVSVHEREPRVNKAVEEIEDLTQNEYDALSSLNYQGGFDGLDAVCGILKAEGNWNKRRKIAGCEFLLWDTDSRGNHLDGLLKRRAREVAVFLAAEYGDLTTVPLWRGPHKGPNKVAREEYVIREEDIPL